MLTLVLALFLAWPAAAREGAPRVGVLGPAEEPRFSELAGGLRDGLRAHGWGEPTLALLEARVPRADRVAARAGVEALRRRGPAALFVIGSELARVAREVAPQVPLVFITPGDPVAAGLVASLARPGGNVTAITFEYPELSGKRLELLREIAPGTRRVLVLYDPRDASPRQGVAAAREAAGKLGLVLVERPVNAPEDVARGLEALTDVQGLLAIPGGGTSVAYAEMIRAAHAWRIPTMFHARSRSTGEALATYGTSDVAVARQAARLVDKILRGARPGDLPVERPTRIDLILNLRTARALGLTIPPAVLLRADALIE